MPASMLSASHSVSCPILRTPSELRYFQAESPSPPSLLVGGEEAPAVPAGDAAFPAGQWSCPWGSDPLSQPQDRRQVQGRT